MSLGSAVFWVAHTTIAWIPTKEKKQGKPVFCYIRCNLLTCDCSRLQVWVADLPYFTTEQQLYNCRLIAPYMYYIVPQLCIKYFLCRK